MSKNLKFIEIIKRESVYQTVADEPWKTKLFTYPPYEGINPSREYMFTLGSAYISLATVAYGFQYVSAIDVFRHAFNSSNPSEPLVNVDHYIAGSISPDQFAVFKTPPQSYHWLKPTDGIITEIPLDWQMTVRDMLSKDRK